jgi:hypothetical protein
MGKLIISTQITLDGVMTVGEWYNQHGEHDWHGSAGQAALDQLRAADAFILGRKNYEGLAAVWPTLHSPPPPRTAAPQDAGRRAFPAALLPPLLSIPHLQPLRPQPGQAVKSLR